jgi:hypothetical protein
VTRLHSGKVVDACVASAVQLCAKPGSENLLREVIGKGAVGKAQHVRVIPDSRTFCLSRIGAQRGTDARALVRGDADSRSVPTKEDALIALTARHGLGRGLCAQRQGTSEPTATDPNGTT